MNKVKVALLIRVYDRIEDLTNNLRIIKDTWNSYDYHIIVVSNGKNQGYHIPDESKLYIDNLVELDENWGHRKGSAQLLQEGMKYIPADCHFTIILEADTWIYSDQIVFKYIKLMKADDKIVWASADWYDKDYSLAVDFAIIKSEFIVLHPRLFDIDLYPECYIANYLNGVGASFISIKENMPVHIPSYVPYYPYIDDIANKRFYIFPQSKMITHHIEYLEGGISEKKKYFNLVSNTEYFAKEMILNRFWKLFKIRFWIGMSRILPKKSWIKKKEYRILKK